MSYDYLYEVAMPKFGRCDFVITPRQGFIVVAECKKWLSWQSVGQVLGYKYQLNADEAWIVTQALDRPKSEYENHVFDLCNSQNIVVVEIDPESILLNSNSEPLVSLDSIKNHFKLNDDDARWLKRIIEGEQIEENLLKRIRYEKITRSKTRNKAIMKEAGLSSLKASRIRKHEDEQEIDKIRSEFHCAWQKAIHIRESYFDFQFLKSLTKP